MSLEVSLEQKLEVMLSRVFPTFQALTQTQRLSGGASQETYRLVVETANGAKQLAMRRSPAGLYEDQHSLRPGLETEALLMNEAKATGIPGPEIYYVLQDDDNLGRGFLMEWLDGEALGSKIVRSPQFEKIRPSLAYECGRILAGIHSIDHGAAGFQKKLKTLTPAESIDQLRQHYYDLNSPQPMIDYAIRWLVDNVPKNSSLTLVHNDFRNGNLLVSENGIAAVLDWELAHIGDPMRDLGWLCTNSWRFGSDLPVGGFGDYSDLFKGYESVSGKKVDPERVKFWQVFGSASWAYGCLSTALNFRNGPDKTVEKPAIGRRSSEAQIDCINLLCPGRIELINPAESLTTTDIPRSDELLASVSEFLRDDISETSKGRTKFLARVAANSLDIIGRELVLGAQHRQREHDRLRSFYQSDADSSSLRWRLCEDIRNGVVDLSDKTLQAHLRHTVANQVAIDQPKYSGLRQALAMSSS